MGRRKGSVAPDSRRARLSRLFTEWLRHGQTRVSFAEILAGYETAYPNDRATHDSLTSSVSALVHAGELDREPGGGREMLYLLAPSGHVEIDDSALTRAVVEIVELHYELHRCPISTAAIGAALRKRALWPERFAGLHALLRRLSSDADTDSDGWGLVLPAVQRADARTAIGEAVAHWAPVGVPAQCATTPSSRADALRRAVAAAASALGRPVSKRELRWWLDAQPSSSPLRAMLDPSGLGPHLQHTSEHDAPHVPSLGRLQVVDGPLTCHGGAPKRYLHRSPSSEELAASRLDDALFAIRPASELAGLMDLETLARAMRSPTLTAIAQTRRRVFVLALQSYTDLDGTATALGGRDSFDTLTRWLDDSTRSYAALHSRRLQLAEVRQQLDAALQLVAATRSQPSHRAARPSRVPSAAPTLYAGRAGLVPVTAIRDFAAHAAAVGELDTPRPELTYARARRFPNPALASRPAADELALLDRADAVLAVFSAASPRRAIGLLAAARLVLGEVLRDTEFVREQVARATAEAGDVRRSLLLALALLGECAEPELVVLDIRNTEDAATYVLSAVVAELHGERAYHRVLACTRRVRGSAHTVTRRALEALEAGRLLSILE